ncbi:hypothetical protein DSL92_07200 [Billgrantia gudaonensis]|uniref:Uncharacterized protein n=1 Tax=Billgrantia gudaonensis TaxID=376427 RepID=A0A432JI73_9GAMM|nr:hypothetical protein DSL92_07200 [Halomonas gudaonensis]
MMAIPVAKGIRCPRDSRERREYNLQLNQKRGHTGGKANPDRDKKQTELPEPKGHAVDNDKDKRDARSTDEEDQRHTGDEKRKAASVNGPTSCTPMRITAKLHPR